VSEIDLDELRERLKGDPCGLRIIDFETYPEMTINGIPVTREQRIDGASMRPAIQELMAVARRVLEPPVLGSAFDKATITVEVRA